MSVGVLAKTRVFIIIHEPSLMLSWFLNHATTITDDGASLEDPTWDISSSSLAFVSGRVLLHP